MDTLLDGRLAGWMHGWVDILLGGRMLHERIAGCMHCNCWVDELMGRRTDCTDALVVALTGWKHCWVDLLALF